MYSPWLDPMIFAIWMKGWGMKKLGFRRLSMGVGPDKFHYYYRKAQGENPFCLVLVHGIALFPEWWKPMIPWLPKNCAICAPELLGFGRSPGRKLEKSSFKLSLYNEQLLGLKKAHGWDKLVLGGVSLGGWVCLDFALNHPDAVKSLVLISPGGAICDVEKEEDLFHLRKIFDYEDAAEFIALINDYVLSKPIKIPNWVGAMAVKRSQWNGHKSLIANLTLEDWVGKRANKIQAPCALIWGEEDKVFPYSVGEELSRIMPKARLFPLANTGHSYLFEQPQATSRAFVEGLDWVRSFI